MGVPELFTFIRLFFPICCVLFPLWQSSWEPPAQLPHTEALLVDFHSEAHRLWQNHATMELFAQHMAHSIFARARALGAGTIVVAVDGIACFAKEYLQQHRRKGIHWPWEGAATAVSFAFSVRSRHDRVMPLHTHRSDFCCRVAVRTGTNVAHVSTTNRVNPVLRGAGEESA